MQNREEQRIFSEMKCLRWVLTRMDFFFFPRTWPVTSFSLFTRVIRTTIDPWSESHAWNAHTSTSLCGFYCDLPTLGRIHVSRKTAMNVLSIVYVGIFFGLVLVNPSMKSNDLCDNRSEHKKKILKQILGVYISGMPQQGTGG